MHPEKVKSAVSSTAIHIGLLLYAALALFPVLLVAVNSVKTKNEIFNDPLGLPSPTSLFFGGYDTVWRQSNFPNYFLNSGIVTVGSLTFTLLIGAMASFALSEYRFRGNRWIALYLTLGLMIPIRLGTVAILNLMVDLSLVNTLLSLILVYTAMNLPVTVLILSAFMRQVSDDLKNAARVDGASEIRILFTHVIPIIRPAMATVAIFTMIPVWNDLWFPLILAPGEGTKTVILGAQQFIGQFRKDWNAMLAALTLSVVPTIILYFIFSRQLIAGITRGGVK